MFGKKSQGTAGAWIYAMLVLFVIVMLWSIFSHATGPVFEMTEDLIEQNNYTEAGDTLDVIKVGWNNWVLVMVVGAIIFVISRAIRVETFT